MLRNINHSIMFPSWFDLIASKLRVPRLGFATLPDFLPHCPGFGLLARYILIAVCRIVFVAIVLLLKRIIKRFSA